MTAPGKDSIVDIVLSIVAVVLAPVLRGWRRRRWQR